MKPKFSIIIPVFNLQEWIEPCLRSVIRQKVGDWECICVDDGSVDDSGSILDRFAAEDGRFRVIHKANEGVSSARNAALDLASGEWIVYIDGDDVLSGDALLIFERIIEAVPHAEMLQYENRAFVGSADCPLIVQDVNDFPILSLTDKGGIFGRVGDISFVAYAYKRIYFGDLRFRDYSIGEDRLYLAMCLARCRCLAYCKAVGYIYRIRTDSAVHQYWSVRNFTDNLNSGLEILQVAHDVGKVTAKNTIRGLVDSITEQGLANVCKMKADKEIVNNAWNQWFLTLGEIKCASLVTLWQKVSILILRKNHSRILARIFCLWPHKLKLFKYKIKRFRLRVKKPYLPFIAN